MYNLIRVPYRFAVGTISGAVGWVTYFATPVLGYMGYTNLEQIQSFSKVSYNGIQKNYPQLPSSEKISQKVSGVSETTQGALELTYKSFTSTKWGQGLPETLFDAKATEGSATSFTGALTLLQQNVEHYSGDLQQYAPVAKVVAGAFVAHKLGFFEMASFISKQVELTVESWFMVDGDVQGLFDIPYMVADIFSGVYKTSIATISKIPYVVGYSVGAGLSLAGPEVIVSSARYMRYDSHEQMSVDSYRAYAANDISSYKWYYGAVAVLFGAHNFESINTLANTCGKGFELGFEHILLLSGDTPGLLDTEFYSK